MCTSFLRTYAHILLAIAIFLIPWHAVVIVRDIFINHEKWHYGTIGIYLGDIVLLAAILCVVFAYRTTVTTLRIHHVKKWAPAILFALWCFASILWSVDPVLSLATAIRITLAIATLFAVKITPQKHILLWAFIIGATVQSLYGVWQFSTQTSPTSSFFGIATHDVTWGSSATITTESDRWLRAYGAMPHPNILGGYAAIAMCITYGLLFAAIRPYVRGLLISASAVLYLALLCSGSRSALVALYGGITIFATLHYRHILTRHTTALIAIMTLITTTVLFLFAYHDIFLTRTLHSTTIATNAITERASYLNDARHLIATHPLHGTGVGAYTSAAYRIHAPTMPIWEAQPVHIVYLLILAELGIIGCGLLLWAAWTVRKKLHHIVPSPLHSGMYAACGALLIIGVFDHWPWTAHVGVTTVAVCIGALFTATRPTQDVPPRQ